MITSLGRSSTCPDKFIASGGDDNLVRVWAVSNQTIIYTLNGHTAEIRCVTFSPDGTILASSGDDNLILL